MNAKSLFVDFATLTWLFLSAPAAAQDHPPLRHIVVHNVTVDALQARCPQTYACATADFSLSRCDVFIPFNTPAGWPSRTAMLRHELRHCNGKGKD